MAKQAQSDAPTPFEIQDVSSEVMMQQLATGITPDTEHKTTENRLWEDLTQTPNLQSFVIRRAVELAPHDLATRGLIIRGMLGVIGLMHADAMTTELEQMIV